MKGISKCCQTKANRSTTYYSLKAFVLMVYADNKEEFVKYYRLASHDNAGKGTWHYIEKYRNEEERRVKCSAK